ncbi:MAG TPA: hypothetical protein VFI73_12320 [Candidatus Nitrosopolaris sp.]|nr:hypothetical protein [Candidatus Nitrosopolaris sp.]
MWLSTPFPPLATEPVPIAAPPTPLAPPLICQTVEKTDRPTEVWQFVRTRQGRNRGLLASYDKKSHHHSFQKILKRYPQGVLFTYYIYAGRLSVASGPTLGPSIFFMVISASDKSNLSVPNKYLIMANSGRLYISVHFTTSTGQ